MADADVKAPEAPAAVAEVAEEAPKKPVDPDFEPEIIVFACHYCAYAAADLTHRAAHELTDAAALGALDLAATLDANRP